MATIDGLTLTLVSLGFLILLGFYFWYLKKRYPELTIGETITMLTVKDSETLFIVIIMFLNFAEAMMAASIHPQNQDAPNPIARFMAHTIIQVISAIGGIIIWRDALMLFQPGTLATKIVRFFKVFIAFIMLAIIPIINLFVIANGLLETTQLMLFFKSFIYSDTEIDAIAGDFGLPVPYSPWANLSYIMTASNAVTFVHLLVIGYEGLAVVDPSNAKRREEIIREIKSKREEKEDKKKEGSTKEDKKKEAEAKKEEDISKLEDNVAWFLNRIKDGKADTHKSEILGKLEKCDVNVQIDLARAIASTRKIVLEMESRVGMSKTDTEHACNKALLALIDRIGASTTEPDVKKRGLGVILTKKHVSDVGK